VLAPINVSAQVGLPGWVKGRGLALFATVQFGGMALGSALWGQVANMAGLPAAHILAAAGALIAIPLLSRWKLHTGAALDLTPSMHWPAPVTAVDIEMNRGPVKVTIEYQIDPADRTAFIAAIDELAAERRRDGAYDWGIYEDAAVPGRMFESFLVASWLEHQRQHRRVTHADRSVQERVHAYHRGASAPTVRHFIAAVPSDPEVN
jgi:Transmembrane secretion effector